MKSWISTNEFIGLVDWDMKWEDRSFHTDSISDNSQISLLQHHKWTSNVVKWKKSASNSIMRIIKEGLMISLNLFAGFSHLSAEGWFFKGSLTQMSSSRVFCQMNFKLFSLKFFALNL